MPRKPKINGLYKSAVENELAAIAKTLKARRIELGWTQNKLAEKLECEVPTIQAYEQKRRTPSLGTLLTMCKLMKLKLTIG